MSEAAEAVLGLITMLHVVRYGPMLAGWSMAGASAALAYAAVTQPDPATCAAAALWFAFLAMQVRGWGDMEASANYIPRPPIVRVAAASAGDAACGIELDDADEIELAQAAGAMAEGRFNEGRDRFERWLDDTVPHWRDLR